MLAAKNIRRIVAWLPKKHKKIGEDRLHHLKGISTKVPYKGPTQDILTSLERGIRSGFSYTGAKNITELQVKAKFIKQTSAGQFESSTHIDKRYK
jgi:IMP dehydrogenase/GMP reductase